MKNLFILIAILGMQIVHAAPKQAITHIEPESWFVGMVNTQLQLLVHGTDINFTEFVGTDTPGVQVTNVVHPNSPNCLLVYLDLSCAEAGNVTLYFRRGNKDVKYTYTLRKRSAGVQSRTGLTNSDILYTLGGTTANTRQALDGIQDMGATALCVQYNMEIDSQHHAALAADCHARGMKLLLGLNINNCLSTAPVCKDVPMVDWFNGINNQKLYTQPRTNVLRDPYASQKDIKSVTCGWQNDSLPDYNLDNPHVARYLVQQAKWMVESTGIDGLCLSGYPYVSRTALTSCLKDLHAEYPDMNIVGLDHMGNTVHTAAWQTDSRIKGQADGYFDLLPDATLSQAITTTATEETQADNCGLNRVYNTLACDLVYRAPHNLLVEYNEEQGRQAAIMALTLPRTPMFKAQPPADMQKLLQWRRNSKAISRGITTQFAPHSGIYAYFRRYGDQRVLVLLNGTDGTVAADMARYAEVTGSAQSGRDVLTGKAIELTGSLSLSPRQGLVIEF